MDSIHGICRKEEKNTCRDVRGVTVAVVFVVLAGAGRDGGLDGRADADEGGWRRGGSPLRVDCVGEGVVFGPADMAGLFDGMGIWGMVLAGAKAPFLGAKRASGNTWLPRYVWMYLVTYLEVQPTVHKVSTAHRVGK